MQPSLDNIPCWYCGKPLSYTSDSISLAPLFIFSCANHLPWSAVNFVILELNDKTLKLHSVDYCLSEEFILSWFWMDQYLTLHIIEGNGPDLKYLKKLTVSKELLKFSPEEIYHKLPTILTFS